MTSSEYSPPEGPPDWYQYIYCAVCMECQDLIAQPQLAVTIVNGTAACEEHRRRASFNFGSVVSNARKFYQEGPRSARTGNGSSRR